MSPMPLRWIIWIAVLCSTLYISRYISLVLPFGSQVFTIVFHFSTLKEAYNPGDFINLGFSRFALQEAKLREIELEYEYDLTAVLLHWQRLQGIQKTLKHLLDTHFFKEIIIWNNNPQINLTIHQVLINEDLTTNIRIINSKENFKNEGKYRACAEAKTRACFYADSDWNTSHYIKSLVASFRSDPNLLHLVTDFHKFYTNLMWSYFDDTIDLHTGFAWIGCTSIFLREHAQRHIQLLYKFLKNNSALIQMSDVFFSIWVNDIPSQMNTNTRDQHSTSADDSLTFPSTLRFRNLLYTNSVVAIRILEHSLRFDRSNNSDITFPRRQNRRFPYYAKSPSFRDDFIFYTNVLLFELQNMTFNISQDFDQGTRRNPSRIASMKNLASHDTWKAVDGNLATCWHSAKAIRSGDFYAIDFLRIKTNITFILSVAHSSKLQTNLDVSISFDGLWWISYRSQKGIYQKTHKSSQQLYTILFSSDEFALGFESFRYIAFKAIDNSGHRFQVCELEIILEKNINGILDGFQ